MNEQLQIPDGTERDPPPPPPTLLEHPIIPAADLPSVITDFVRLYKDRRAEFVTNVFDIKLQKWQAEMFKAQDEGASRIAIKSGHGVGKTAYLSWNIIHHLITRFPQKTQVTAPTSGQLFDALAAETKRWMRNLPQPFNELFLPKSDRIELIAAPEASFTAFRTSRPDLPEALQGVHSKFVQLVADEASGIPESVYQAAGGSLSGLNTTFLLAGNPTRSEGYFYNKFAQDTPGWTLRTVSGYESTLVSQDYIDSIGREYGYESNVFRVRIQGEFPLETEDKLIPLYLLERAVDREIDLSPHWGKIWGLDVARSGSDRTALVERVGRVVTRCQTWPALGDLMEICGKVLGYWNKLKPSQRPLEICVDCIGIGAGVADRLAEMKDDRGHHLPAVPINVAESSSMNPQAMRLRDDLWLQCRDWFMRQDVSIPNHPGLLKDLQAPTYKLTSTGKYKVAAKDEMKAAGYRSPDLGDALALTFGSAAGLAIHGSDHPASSWGKPLNVNKPAIV